MAKKRKGYFWQTGKTRWFWVPLADAGQLDRAQLYCDEFSDCKMLTDWDDVQEDDDVIVYAHGSETNPDAIYGTPSGGTEQRWTYTELAQAVMDNVDSALAFQIKLYVCFSSERKVKEGAAPDSKRYCFAGQFFSVLKTNGYKKIKVAGYSGELVTSREDDDVKKYGKLCKIDNRQTKGTLQSKIATNYVKASSHREWFTDNLLGTRWL